MGVISLKLAILIVSGFPNTANASLFSAVSNIFASTVPQAEESDVNSQKMPLLEAPVNISMPDSKTSVSVLAAAANQTLALEPVGQQKTDQPASSDTITTYKVAKGDTISEIAEKFNISVNTILWANNLKKTSTLTVGQSLVILPVNGVQHMVAKGDTLLSIAAKYKADVDEILSYNDLDKNDVIKPGDTLIIPGGEIAAPAASPASSVKKVASAVLKSGIVKASAEVLEYYMRPLKGGVRTQGIHGNNAVDLADSCGTPIYASAAGTVTVARNDGAWNGGYGNYVVISHDNGSQTLYGHMQTVAVSEGDTVAKGENIGAVGATGKVQGVTGCHVHFEIRNGPRNPF